MVVTVLRWIGVGVMALLAVGALATFAIYIAFESRPSLERARKIGAWMKIVALFWFNLEVWGRVVHTIVTWK